MQKQEKYLIMNKDKKIGEFIWIHLDNGEQPYVELIKDINLPSFISNNFSSWIKNRIAPKHRKRVSQILKEYQLNTDKDIIDFCKALSLTDTFWVQKEDELLKWGNINLYGNNFSDIVSKIAFNTGLYGMNFSSTHPELTTDGFLPKCWIREKGSIYLKKGGTEGYRNSGNEPHSEVLATQILDKLDYNHVGYKLEKFKSELVSSCEIMTDTDNMLIPLSSFLNINVNEVNKVRDFCKDVSEKCFDDFNKMILFDYIILNSDRHTNNIGFIVDSRTYKIKNLAPIYDNGAGMLCYFDTTEEYQSLDKYLLECIPKTYDSFLKEAIISKRYLNNKHNLTRLLDFKFNNSSLDIDINRVQFINNFINNRVKSILKL